MVKIDIRKFVRFEKYAESHELISLGEYPERLQALGVLSLKRAGSYEIVVMTAAGKIETRNPHMLRPAI